jgi:prepilin-type N-terminal cleavage/methylation domain-containing protein
MRSKRSAAGYNLVEVLIAMAVFGAVVLSIFTLFFMGRWNTYSGRKMTEAVAVGQKVLEDLSPMNRKNIYSGAFNIAATDTGLGSVTFTSPAATYTNCRIRSTDANIVASPPTDIQTQTTGGPDLLGRWTTLLGTRLQGGSVTVIMTPANDATNNPAQFGTASMLRMRVLVRWREQSRPRELILDSVKAY